MSTHNLIVRPLTPNDISACAALYIRTFSAPPWCDGLPTDKPVIAYFENFLQLDAFLGYIALQNGKLVALSAGMKKPWIGGVEYYIDEFCVDPDLQGQGIGSKFLAAIEEDLSPRGMRGILLNTEENYPAFDFYIKNGFKVMGNCRVLGK